jgi:hypothetical protein
MQHPVLGELCFAPFGIPAVPTCVRGSMKGWVALLGCCTVGACEPRERLPAPVLPSSTGEVAQGGPNELAAPPIGQSNTCLPVGEVQPGLYRIEDPAGPEYTICLSVFCADGRMRASMIGFVGPHWCGVDGWLSPLGDSGPGASSYAIDTAPSSPDRNCRFMVDVSEGQLSMLNSEPESCAAQACSLRSGVWPAHFPLRSRLPVELADGCSRLPSDHPAQTEPRPITVGHPEYADIGW